MPTIEGVTCSISTSNTLFTEYADCDDLRAYDADHQSGPIRSCYIESQEEQEFQVTIDPGNFGSRHPEASQFALTFSLDGAANRGIANTILFDGLQRTSGLIKYRNGQCFEHHFRFGKLAVIEDAVTEDGTAGPQKDPQQLGEFSVMLYRFKRTAIISVPMQNTQESARTANKVHEKQLKGRDIAHAVGVGRIEKIPTKSVMEGIWLDPVNYPYMTFRFCYRSQRKNSLSLSSSELHYADLKGRRAQRTRLDPQDSVADSTPIPYRKRHEGGIGCSLAR